MLDSFLKLIVNSLQKDSIQIWLLIYGGACVWFIYILARASAVQKGTRKYLQGLDSIRNDPTLAKLKEASRPHHRLSLSTRMQALAEKPHSAVDVGQVAEAALAESFSLGGALRVAPNLFMLLGILGTVLGLWLGLGPLAESVSISGASAEQAVQSSLVRALSEIQSALFAGFLGILAAAVSSYFIQGLVAEQDRQTAQAVSLLKGEFSPLFAPPTDADAMQSMRLSIGQLSVQLGESMTKVANVFAKVEGVTSRFDETAQMLGTSSKELVDQTKIIEEQFDKAVSEAHSILLEVQSYRTQMDDQVNSIMDRMAKVTEGNHELIKAFRESASSQEQAINESRIKIEHEFGHLADRFGEFLRDHRSSAETLANDVRQWDEATKEFTKAMLSMTPVELTALGEAVTKSAASIQSSSTALLAMKSEPEAMLNAINGRSHEIRSALQGLEQRLMEIKSEIHQAALSRAQTAVSFPQQVPTYLPPAASDQRPRTEDLRQPDRPPASVQFPGDPLGPASVGGQRPLTIINNHTEEPKKKGLAGFLRWPWGRRR